VVSELPHGHLLDRWSDRYAIADSERREGKLAGTEEAPSPPQTEHWLKRIAKALSFSNVMLIVAAIIAVPGGILAWSQWVEGPKKDRLDREAAARAERVAVAEEAQANAIANLKDGTGAGPGPASNAVDAVEAPSAAAPSPPAIHVEPRVIVQPPSVSPDAELSRPYVSLTNWSLQKVAVGEGAEWLITMENSGRPAMVSMTDYQVVYEGDGPSAFPTCADTIKFGGTHPMKGPQKSLLKAGRPMDQAAWEAYQKGTPIMLVATYCYRDEVTKRQHVTHVCLKGYANGTVMQCRRGNEIN